MRPIKPTLCSALLIMAVAVSNPIYAQTSAVGGDFTLIDHHGQTFNLKQLRGKVVLVFFGYTFCPDICPTELASMAQLNRTLGTQKDQLQVLFITVDPARDTPEQLKEYVRFFSEDLIGLSGSEQQIEAVKQAYHVQSKIFRKHASDQNYSVDHSANLYVIDQAGKLVNIVPYGFPLAHVEQIVRALIGEQPT